MANGKKSFVLYADLIHTVEKLSNEDAGQLLKHLLRYVNDQEPITENALVDLAFEPIKHQLKRDLKKWKDLSDKRRDAANERWSKQKNANASKCNNLHYDNVTVNVNDNVNDNEKDILLIRFVGWGKESGLDVNKVENQFLKAWDYYSERKWVNKYNKPISNKFTTIRNNWFKDLNDFKPKLNIDALVLHCAMQAPEEMQKLCNKYQVNQQVIEQLYHDSRKQ